MSILNEIHFKIMRFNMNCADPSDVAHRIMLGREILMQFERESDILLTYKSTPTGGNEILGLKLIITKRAKYIRILPKKLKYMKKTAFMNGASVSYKYSVCAPYKMPKLFITGSNIS